MKSLLIALALLFTGCNSVEKPDLNAPKCICTDAHNPDCEVCRANMRRYHGHDH